METNKPKTLHVVFLPFPAPGHMIPILDTAILFATHHVKTTIITTPRNAPTFLNSLKTYKNPNNHPPIDVEIIQFPSKEAGYPQGVENFTDFSSFEPMNRFSLACQKLEGPIENVLEKIRPNCLVADLMFAFATRVAEKFNIPRLVFHGSGYFPNCVMHSMWTHLPPTVMRNMEEFLVPHVPHEMKFKRSQMPSGFDEEVMEFYARASEAEAKSYGILVNSFHELEPEYVHHYRNVVGRKAWHIGPVSLCNRENETKFQRGKQSSIDQHECLKWLDSKIPSSVVYICFGSLCMMSMSQLREIMAALEFSGKDFIWVVGKISNKTNDDENEGYSLDEFEKRIEGKGLIIRGWAPQVLILEHESIGAFLTHCGWNSILEGISSGVPMVTWPVFAEQHVNEKLVTEVLKIGVGVGAEQWGMEVEGNVRRDSIKEAIERVMVGEEAIDMKKRVNKLKEMARKAIEEGGSSYSQLELLIQELNSYNVSKG